MARVPFGKVLMRGAEYRRTVANMEYDLARLVGYRSFDQSKAAARNLGGETPTDRARQIGMSFHGHDTEAQLQVVRGVLAEVRADVKDQVRDAARAAFVIEGRLSCHACNA